jgi:hypothetical protein
MWWLCWKRNGALLGVAIVEAYSLSAARMRAALAELGRGGVFSEGHRLDAHCRALVTPEDIGRVLSPAEAGMLLARFERRRPPAPSVHQRVRRAQQA